MKANRHDVPEFVKRNCAGVVEVEHSVKASVNRTHADIYACFPVNPLLDIPDHHLHSVRIEAGVIAIDQGSTELML